MKQKDIAIIFVFIVLTGARTASLFIPLAYAARFVALYRPIIYLTAVIVLYFVNGRYRRPIPGKSEAFMVAVIGAVLYYLLTLVMALVDGYATNGMTPSIRAALLNLWTYGSYILFAELIRYNIIKNAPARSRVAYAVILTLIYTYVQIDGLRSAVIYGIEGAAGFFFTAVIPPLLLNTVLTYMAFSCSLGSLLLLHAAYTLSPMLLPYLPATSRATLSALYSALLFVTALIYYFVVGSGGSRADQIRERRWSRHQKMSFGGMVIPALLIGLILAFNMRVFPYYSVTVLTGSMTGAIDQGSVAFVEKVPPGLVFDEVEKGDIIHYSYGRTERLHRVIEFEYDAGGERVYITKGDANDRPDSYPVEQAQVIGIARGYIPYIGWPFVIIYDIFH